jgi:hypothetical protein
LTSVPGLFPISLGYTRDGARLVAGTPSGFQVRDAAAGYALLTNDVAGAVLDVAVAPSGGWIALVRRSSVSVRRSPDLGEVATLSTGLEFRDADFSPDGAVLAVAEVSGQVRRFRAHTWQELSPIPLSGRVDAVAYRPQGFGQRIPVVFIHGHSGGSADAWFNTTGGTSFAAALAANPQLPLDVFYMELPLHGSAHPGNQGRSIEEDAQDVLAVIEGGVDSRGGSHVGILNMPAYQGVGRVAIIAYSQGTMSSRSYLKNLMGSRRNGAITVSEFVALAAPNHGVGDLLSCGDANEPDRARRQLCGGRTGTLVSQSAACGACPLGGPSPFATNQPGDDAFITNLNGHPLSQDCDGSFSHPAEAPASRPSRPDGVLYVNLFAAGNGDGIVGGATQAGDCLGRRLARNHAPDAMNMEVGGVPGILGQVHANFPHHWPTICSALRTVVDHQPPADPAQACAGLTQP